MLCGAFPLGQGYAVIPWRSLHASRGQRPLEPLGSCDAFAVATACSWWTFFTFPHSSWGYNLATYKISDRNGNILVTTMLPVVMVAIGNLCNCLPPIHILGLGLQRPHIQDRRSWSEKYSHQRKLKKCTLTMLHEMGKAHKHIIDEKEMNLLVRKNSLRL